MTDKQPPTPAELAARERARARRREQLAAWSVLAALERRRTEHADRVCPHCRRPRYDCDCEPA